MEHLLWLLLLPMVIILWMISIPLYLSIDTGLKRYELGQWLSFRLTMEPGADRLLRLFVFGIEVPLNKQMNKPAGKEARASKKKGIRSLKRSWHSWQRLASAVWGCIRLYRLKATVDLEDVVLNAQLYPIMKLLTKGPVQLSTNFNRQYYFSLYLECRLYKIMGAVLRFFFNK